MISVHRCLPLVALALAACQPPVSTPRSRADMATKQSCRAEVDRVYNAQNRADLSRRDERDTAFSANYDSGITSRGMSARFGRDQMISDCVQTNAREPGAQPADTTPPPTFSPVQR